MIHISNFLHSQAAKFNTNGPFTIRARGNLSARIYQHNDPDSVSVQISLDQGENWRTYYMDSWIDMTTYPQVWFKNTVSKWSKYDYDAGHETRYELQFQGTGKARLGGRLASLVNNTTSFVPHMFQCFLQGIYNSGNYTEFIEQADITFPDNAISVNCYDSMFQCNSGLEIGPSILPVTSFPANTSEGCYNSMFKSCGKLKRAPILPATTLSMGCYSGMFQYCTGLKSIPYLPATTLVPYCYSGMFEGCNGLTQVYLPATSIGDHSLLGMFRECENLHRIEVDFTEWPTNGGTDYWVEYLENHGGEFICPESLPQIHDEHHIPRGWAVIRKG